MSDHPDFDLYETAEGRQILLDRKTLLDEVFATFAAAFTRRFLRPHARVLIKAVNAESDITFSMLVREGDADAQLAWLTERLGDDSPFQIKVYDGRVLFGRDR